MDQVSRPLLIALVSVVAVFAVWMVALRPHGSSGGTPTPAPQPAAQAAGPSNPTHTRPKAPSATVPARYVHPAARVRSVTSGRVSRLATVERGLAAGKVLALLFYNPAAADDQAVRQELQTIPTAHGRVLKVAVPLSELAGYVQLTGQVPINYSPTLVIVGRDHQAQEIVGFADSLEISQRLAAAGT